MYPTNALPVIETVAKDSAAEHAGIQSGDKILAVNGIPVENNVAKLIELIQPHAQQEITLQIDRDNAQQDILITPDEKVVLGKHVGSLGVSFIIAETTGLPFFSAIKQGFKHANSIIVSTLQAFRYIFSKGDVSQMAGPVMLISATAKGAGKGLRIFLIFLAIISINLAILNLIPLPILDGGQALFYTIEAIIGRSLSLKIKEYIHMASWLMILALTLYLSYKDILRIFSFRIFGS